MDHLARLRLSKFDGQASVVQKPEDWSHSIPVSSLLRGLVPNLVGRSYKSMSSAFCLTQRITTSSKRMDFL
ncbi:hypothetical protein Y032_0032g2619 [Ancylostoma ceylanicum]|uniref:Uncharacterized protein n=1 Tax=Ancylostoma ceylanicum TaxID=53326 RepID=A0A016UPD2_9BILA|nr:hypothetical protein Y032_0032g2619 [Ancylostoma ceylanicum]